MTTNKHFFNKNILYFVAIFFVLIVLARIVYSYNKVEAYQLQYAKKEAQSLKDYSMVHRKYYQNLYIDEIIPLNEKSLQGLPAYSSREISSIFSEQNNFDIRVKTVSDRARNPKNTADKLEMQAINYLKANQTVHEYFDDSDEKTYQYAYALRIEQKCLLCHGEKRKAPVFIQEKYDKSYNYKLGEVRGIVSIQLPKETLNKFFSHFFYSSVVYDALLLFLLFTFIMYLLYKFKSINGLLEAKVNIKTLEILKNNENLEKLLITDRLTNLLNRQKLIEDVASSIDSSSRHLALLNIDRFKEINDFYGHVIADKILQEIADLLASTCKGTVYKLPSDEFAIYTTNEITSKEFQERISAVIKMINETKFNIEEYSIYVSISCGIASNIKPLILKADMALQKAKATRVDLNVYDNSISVENTIKNNIKGLSLLKKSIAEDRIVPYFQAIYNLKTSKIEKYECLARIIKNDGSVVAPYFFLDIAMKSKLYPAVTKSMIKKSFAYFEDKEYEFSINISIEDVLHVETVEFIFDALSHFKNPQKVVFEILESEKVENYEELEEFILKVKDFGCKVAIDDFGSGYSNFSHIMNLHVDYLKIDASLVKNILVDENSRKITQTIINFAHNLGLKTIAEYVEDEESLKLLQEMQSDYAQGYIIHKPSESIVS